MRPIFSRAISGIGLFALMAGSLLGGALVAHWRSRHAPSALHANPAGRADDDADAGNQEPWDDNTRWFSPEAKRLQVEAHVGDAGARYRFGLLYCRGVDGVPQDTAKGMKWLLRAANQGEAGAQVALGLAYLSLDSYHYGYDSRFPKPNSVAAAMWVRRAAEQDDVAGQFYLGVLHHSGCGVPQDDAEAVAWWMKAAEKGDLDARTLAGYMYKIGKGTALQDDETLKFYRTVGGVGRLDRNGAELVKQMRMAADQAELWDLHPGLFWSPFHEINADGTPRCTTGSSCGGDPREIGQVITEVET